MTKKTERLLLAIGQIDEKYVKESEGKMKRLSIVKTAIVLFALVALSLYMFLPFAPVTSDLTAYSGSDYFPLIENIEDYRLGLMQPRYKNNFEYMMATLDSMGNLMGGAANGDMAPGAPEMGGSSNGSYVESTDNQVEGVIESDLFKMTDKYIFRLGTGYTTVEYENEKGTHTETVGAIILRVYSIAKEDSELVAEYAIPHFENEYFKSYLDGEMYLSPDGNTVTVIKDYTHKEINKGKVGIISIDVSDINNINTKAMVSIDGSLNTSRMVDGKLLLVSEFFFNRNQVDYNDPSTFVPSIDSGNGPAPMEFEDIIYPDTVSNTRYSVVALLDAENLALLGANALLNFTNEVYVSENHVYITREYTDRTDETDGVVNSSNKTDIALLNYSGERLENKGVITVRGYAEDQYSFDEKDGYLRVVTSTRDSVSITNSSAASNTVKENVSLYIFSLADNSLAYSLEDFAIEGEEATAVRFRGDMVYVCTAVVVKFTDPVYFIDLSDYESISSADTGVIDGYSDHLIDLGDGFLLGIGRENWSASKVEVYEQVDGQVVSVDKFLFDGEYSTDYKSYLVNRDKDMFGFGVNYYYEEIGDSKNEYVYYSNAYVLVQFNGYELAPLIIELEGGDAYVTRAAYIDGYLYITTDTQFLVQRIQ